jgi:hypothetical protein
MRQRNLIWEEISAKSNRSVGCSVVVDQCTEINPILDKMSQLLISVIVLIRCSIHISNINIPHCVLKALNVYIGRIQPISYWLGWKSISIGFSLQCGIRTVSASASRRYLNKRPVLMTWHKTDSIIAALSSGRNEAHFTSSTSPETHYQLSHPRIPLVLANPPPLALVLQTLVKHFITKPYWKVLYEAHFSGTNHTMKLRVPTPVRGPFQQL